MSTNPFEDETEAVETPRQRANTATNPILDDQAHLSATDRATDNVDEGTGRHANFPSSYDYIAKRLLEDNFVLTALEFHAELLESGRELRRLRDYFSNPVHFESVTAANRLDFLPPALRKSKNFGSELPEFTKVSVFSPDIQCSDLRFFGLHSIFGRWRSASG